jgi:hypothetical protein
MPILICVVALLLLWGFIAWDRRSTARPVSRADMQKGWSPKPWLKWPAFAALALVLLALGAIEWAYPSPPPFTGKLSAIATLAHATLGPRGPAYAALCGGAVLFMLALLLWHHEEGKTR